MKHYDGPKMVDHPEDELYRPYDLGGVPKKLFAFIEETAKAYGLPISHMIMRAIITEIQESKVPFKSVDHKLNEEFIDDQYHDEAVKLYEYLSRYQKGASLEQLTFAYMDAGLESPIAVARAYKQLLSEDVIFEYYPNKTKFKYPKDYRYAMVRGPTIKPRRILKDEADKMLGKELNAMLKARKKYGKN